MTPDSLLLTGLDGVNPLGLLAALGTLVTLTEAGETSVRLGWENDGAWHPILVGLRTRDTTKLCAVLAVALRGREVLPPAEADRAAAQKDFETTKTQLKKALDAFRKRGLRGAARAEAHAAEIEPIRRAFDVTRATLLGKLSAAVPRPELAIGNKIDLTGDEFRAKAKQFLRARNAESDSAAALLASFAVEGASEERVVRTDFDFVDSSGRLAFLETVRQLISLVTPARLEATLFRSWRRQDERWSLRWDPVEDRRYALLDRDPTASNNKSRSEWMANLLGYRALSIFPCAATSSAAATAAWSRHHGETSFTWPLWHYPLSLDVIRSLVAHVELLRENPDLAILRAMGVAAAFRSRRIANGDYVNFSPARSVL
jgi:CRISPR-associated endonuclease/helicase Cas3